MINPMIDEFDRQVVAALEEHEPMLCLVRDSGLQQKARGALAILRDDAVALKQDRINANDNEGANYLLSVEAMLDGLVAELDVYINIKQDRPGEAWSRLIDAEHSIRTAMQAHSSRRGLQKTAERLEKIEELFPLGPMSFLSPGLIARRIDCSICGGEYGECGHIVGRPYMGKICCRVLKDMDVHEVSFVAVPANKRARILSFSEGGIKRDLLSWRVIE